MHTHSNTKEERKWTYIGAKFSYFAGIKLVLIHSRFSELQWRF